MQPIVADRVAWSVGLSVCRSVTVVSPAKRLNRSRCRLGCGLGERKEACVTWEHNGASWRIRLNRSCAAAMQSYVKLLRPLVTFCVSRRRRKMYSGHARLCVCVCVSVCLSAAVLPHYCTDPDVTWGRGIEAAPSCALLGGFAIIAPVALLWQHNANPSLRGVRARC